MSATPLLHHLITIMALVDEQKVFDAEVDWEPADEVYVRCCLCFCFTFVLHSENPGNALQYCLLCRSGEGSSESESDNDDTLPWPQPVVCPECGDERIIPAFQSCHPFTPSGDVVMDHCSACTAKIGRGEAAIDNEEDSVSDTTNDPITDDDHTSDFPEGEGEDSPNGPQDEEDYFFEI